MTFCYLRDKKVPFYNEMIYFHCKTDELPPLATVVRGKPHLERLLKRREVIDKAS